jgi:hypothetical protein
MKTGRLIVQPAPNSLEILRYVEEIVVQINQMGMRIQVEKISRDDMDADMLHSLRKVGIKTLPALIIPGKAKPYVGVSEIKKLFESNLSKLHGQVVTGVVTPEEPASDLNDYWMREMTQGMKKGTKGKIEFAEDGPVGEGDSNFDRKMADYRKRIPPHRQGGRAEEQPEEPEESPRPRRRAQPRAQEDEPEDAPAPPRRKPQRAPQQDNIDRTATTGDDAMDRQMMAAWMDNNSATD